MWLLEVLIHPLRQTKFNATTANGFQPLYLEKESPVVHFLQAAFDYKDPVEGLNGGSGAQEPLVARFLFSSESGYVYRSDCVKQRLECSPFVSQAISFLQPLQKVIGVEPTSEIFTASFGKEPQNIFDHAIGVVTVPRDAKSHDLNADLQNRLSAPLLHPEPLTPRRLAWVQGREDIDCIERAFKGAAALGIALVILDERGHWLQDPHSPWAYLREDFIEVDITPDAGLPARVVEAVKSYPKKIDGIVTISDVRLAAIARACQALGLPTEIPEAYDIAGDKGRTRLLEQVGADESFVLPSASHLDAHLKEHGQCLRFPLIVKPVIGWCSDCVSKVQNVEELRIAVEKASERHADAAKPSTAVVIEPYIDGPEVDANFALLDGQIIFLDINDDFPSPADEEDAPFKANFQETQNVMPSGLPQQELDAIREQLRDSILRQGFKSGVFHCEARVKGSAVRYAADGTTVVDLVPKTDGTEGSGPEVYLHEINARPPGYLESVAVLLAYGVDYYALRMLLAVGPEEGPRLRALSQPFLQGAQFHLSLMIIQQTKAGIMKTQDAAKEFLEKHPQVREHVVDYYTRKKGGDVLEGPDASALWWIAYFSVVSRVSRRDLLERVDYIQRHFEYEIEA